MNRLTVVMYHRIFGRARQRHPSLHGIDAVELDEQLGYLKRHHKLVSLEECFAALEGGSRLPPKAALLTFDDGYLDHFTNAYPLLRKHGAPAVFFPCAEPLREGKLLQSNKVHFILAGRPTKELLAQIFRSLDERRARGEKIPPNEALWAKLGHASRFDTAETIFVKRLLQRELPRPLRDEVTSELFSRFVDEDESLLAAETYCTMEQLRIMADDGFAVGAHGWAHDWWDALSSAEMALEIQRSLELLADLGMDTTRWAAAYPYGAHSAGVRDSLASRGCRIAFTTRLGIASLSTENALALERLDTQDLPKKATSGSSPWTKEALKGIEL